MCCQMCVSHCYSYYIKHSSLCLEIKQLYTLSLRKILGNIINNHSPFLNRIQSNPRLYMYDCGIYNWNLKNGIFSASGHYTVKSVETSSWNQTQTECMHFNHSFSCTVYLAKVGVKMHSLSLCFIPATCFSAFYCSPH